MFDRIGEFNSAEEINNAAAGYLKSGDTESIFAIAEENGIDKEDAQDYIDGAVPEMVNPLMAAAGKLKVEAKDLELEGITKDWNDAVIDLCAEDAGICAAVRKKGKNLKDCMASILKFAFENKVRISDKIVDATKVRHNGKEEQMRKPVYLGIPNRTEVKQLIRDYYMK